MYRSITEVLKNNTGGGTMWRSVTVGKNAYRFVDFLTVLELAAQLVKSL